MAAPRPAMPWRSVFLAALKQSEDAAAGQCLSPWGCQPLPPSLQRLSEASETSIDPDGGITSSDVIAEAVEKGSCAFDVVDADAMSPQTFFGQYYMKVGEG